MIGCLVKYIGRSGVLKEKFIAGRNGLTWINKVRFTDVGLGDIATSHQQHEFTNINQYSYTQRAYTPTQMSQQLLHSLTLTHSPQPIIHQLSLYFNKLLPFDYDYFTQSLPRLIPYQQKLSMEEILMLFDLAIQYKIDSLVLEKQFVNQLYCRVYAGVRKELNQYDNYVDKVVGETYKKFQALSKDHFEIISEEFIEQLDQQHKKEKQSTNQSHQIQQQSSQLLCKSKTTTTTTIKPLHNSSVRKNKSKQISNEMFNRITKIFVDFNCKHIEFNRLLLEVLTVRLDEGVMGKNMVEGQLKEMNVDGLLTYARLTVNLLQLYMTEYQSTLSTSKNKDSKYTHRSVKNIYKLQHFYYYEVAKIIEDKQLLTQATNDQLLQFVHVLSSFPIKRRSFRKSVGDVVIGEFKKREIQFEQMMRFFELSRFDNKLLQHFENKINQGKQLEQNKNKSQELQSENGENHQQALMADVIIDPIQSHQTNQSPLFKIPLSLFKKVTKKKSKPKNKKPEENQVEIDLTQTEEEGTQIQNQNKQAKLQQ